MGNTQQKLPQIPPQQPPPPPQEQDREFTCEICIEPIPNPDKKFKNTDKCSHPFCTDCVIKYIRVQLEDNNVGEIKCPAFNCDHTLDAASCAALVGPEVFVRWCDLLCESAILGLDNCYCPNRNCNVVIVNECGVNLRKSKCPNCRRLFCFGCGKVWHAGFGCEDGGEERDGNDVAFGRLVEEKKWMRCPRCRHFVELVAGCRVVHCRCKMNFCYKCGKAVNELGCSCHTYSTGLCSVFRQLLLILLFSTVVVLVIYFCIWISYRYRNKPFKLDDIVSGHY